MASIIASQMQLARPFNAGRQPRARVVHVAAAAPNAQSSMRREAFSKAFGAAAAAALLFGAPVAGFAPPARAADQASEVQKRISGADSMTGSGSPDKSDATLPETSGGSGAGRVPPQAGRSNLTSTSAAPEAAKDKGGIADKLKNALGQ